MSDALAQADPPSASTSLSPALRIFMAAAVGVIVANLYYLQPLLHIIKAEYRIDAFRTSTLITLIQVGYACGLALIVPLGDLFPRRRLVTVIFALASVLIFAASFVQGYLPFAILTVLIGLSSVGGQVLIPFAADLASHEDRGRVIGQMVSGLLSGILLSRTFSGFLAEAVGWRGVYRCAAVLLIGTAVALHFLLPEEGHREHQPYLRLLAGAAAMYREPLMRRRAWIGAMNFGTFSAFWATVAFRLSGAPFHYSSGTIGLFGLFGLAGITSANVAGRAVDRHRTKELTIATGVLLVASFAIFGYGRNLLWAIVLGVIALDLATQAVQVANQAIVYSIDPQKRSRINSALTVGNFTGGALSSLTAGFLYSHYGWSGVCWQGAIMGLLVEIPAVLLESKPIAH